jgi:predicted RNA binding protein YcfA (HicA-like mRNA interferase family)
MQRIRGGQVDNVRFSDFTQLVAALGFEPDRTSGSHRLYLHPQLVERLNLQPLRNGDAKPYQIRQLVRLIEEYSLRLED